MDEPIMTEAQRDELKTLCQKADVPDKSGELLTQEGAQHFIDDLKKQWLNVAGRKHFLLLVCGRCGGRRWRSRIHHMSR